ncbi:Ubox domain containing protein [Balamuthia mandrillaris]
MMMETSLPLRQVLAKQWAERQRHEEEEDVEAEEKKLQEIMVEREAIPTVKKASVFSEALTETEQSIIEQRVALQRRQYEEYTKREEAKQIRKIRYVHRHVTTTEALYSLKACEDDENEAIARLTHPHFLQVIRKRIAKGLKPTALDENGNVIKKKKSSIGSQLGSDSEEEEGEDDGGEEDEEDDEDEEGAESNPSKEHRTIRRMNKRKKSPEELQERRINKVKKLKLDEAVTRAHEGNFEGWSGARIRAWKLIDKNPNAYYYRFNDPGVTQKNGKWSKEEKKLFMKRVEEFGVNGQWGLFSMAIPGRVGYQCSNFYRHLIETRQLTDPNYVIDENGKAHYLFSKGICKHTKKRAKKEAAAAAEAEAEQNQTNVTTKRRSTRKKRKGHDESSESDDEYRPPPSARAKPTDEEQTEEDAKTDNPLPGFVDPITLDEVIQPAISPSGHVMGYKSWSRCLSSSEGICPLTKQPLKKRDLVLLTWDNIDQYIDKIVNMNS